MGRREGRKPTPSWCRVISGVSPLKIFLFRSIKTTFKFFILAEQSTNSPPGSPEHRDAEKHGLSGCHCICSALVKMQKCLSLPVCPEPDFACQSSALTYLLPLLFSRVALEAVSLFLPAGAGKVSAVCGFSCSVGLGQVAAGIPRR